MHKANFLIKIHSVHNIIDLAKHNHLHGWYFQVACSVSNAVAVGLDAFSTMSLFTRVRKGINGWIIIIIILIIIEFI